MFAGSDILFSILAFATFIIIASLLAGYLGSYTNSKFKLPVVEGFTAREDTIDGLNEKVSEAVIDVEDKLRVDKYKDEYKKLVSTSKDLMEGLKLGVLMDLYDISQKDLKDPDRIVNKARSIAINMTQLHKAIEILDKFDFADNSGSSKSDDSDSGGGGGGWF